MHFYIEICIIVLLLSNSVAIKLWLDPLLSMHLQYEIHIAPPFLPLMLLAQAIVVCQIRSYTQNSSTEGEHIASYSYQENYEYTWEYNYVVAVCHGPSCC